MRKKFPKPYWVWPVSKKLLPWSVKHLYAYFCFFGPSTNFEWNCRLAKRFGVSRSTIKRYLKKLVELRLIWITSGRGRHRRIHTHYYSGIADWFSALSVPKVARKPYISTRKTFQDNLVSHIRSLLFFDS